MTTSFPRQLAVADAAAAQLPILPILLTPRRRCSRCHTSASRGGLPAGGAHRRRCPPPPSSTPFADVKSAVRGSGDGQPAVAASCPSPPPRSLPTATPLLPHDRRRPPPANGRRDRKFQPPSSSPPPAAGRPRQAGSPVATADSPPLHHRQTGARLDMPHSRLAPTWELRRSAVGRRRLQALTTACHMRRPGGGRVGPRTRPTWTAPGSKAT